MPVDFEIDGKNYRVGKLNAINQLHLLRKIGPIIAKIAPEFTALSRTARPDAEQVLDDGGPMPLPGADGLGDMIKLIAPVLDALSELKDQDIEYITRLCLSVTSREEGPNLWQAAWNTRANMAQFNDIEGATLIRIAINVIQENLGSFLGVAPSVFGDPAKAPGVVLN